MKDRPPPSGLSTLLGCIAIIAWSLEAVLVAGIESIPTCQAMTIIFGAGFVFTAIRMLIKGNWKVVKGHSKWIWLVGILGVCGSDFAYVLAFKFAPAAHVDLLDYLWPFLVIVFSGFLPNEKHSVKHLLGGIIALGGLYILINHDQEIIGYEHYQLVGYGIAILGAVFWGGYTVLSRHFKSTPPEMIGLYSGIGMVISMLAHLKLETTVIPNTSEWIICITLGLTGAGIAYQLWDYGIKNGNINLLSSLTYLTPAISMWMLVSFGRQDMSWQLVIACGLVVIGVLIGNLDPKKMLIKWNLHRKTKKEGLAT